MNYVEPLTTLTTETIVKEKTASDNF